MATYCGSDLVRWVTFALLVCPIVSKPKTFKDDDSIKEIFSETKRDTSAAGIASVPLLKSPIFNPYFMYPPMVPGKPFMVPLTPTDLLLNKFSKSVAGASSTSKPPIDSSDPSLMSAYFKAKKDEFLTKLFQKLTNATTASDINARSVLPEEDTAADPTTKPVMDSSFFLKKKYEFLDTLFKTLNVTSAPSTVNGTDAQTENSTAATTTPKPTIVPPDFWFPFAKLPKPTKAPKPTKPPKAKKILKDALDTILLQSLLIDMGVDPKDASLNKRAAAVAATSKKTKSKKVKPEEGLTEFHIPAKVDPALYSLKASECLNKLFNILNKTEDDEDLETFVQPKATVIPTNFWNQPSETEYTSKLDAFLDLLIKSLNATDYPSEKPGKPEKFAKSKSGKKFMKRSTFLDELLHRATTPSPTTTTPEPTLPPEDISIPIDPECDFAKILQQYCCCGDKCLGGIMEKSGKSARSLIFKPFGSGFWIPQYLYAAKMGMYLDKLMDTINTAAATEVESESSDVLKRSIDPSDDISGLPSKEAAINLIIAELTDLKNDLVDAFAEGIKAQKDSTPTPKPFNPAAKSFGKKPFWGPKALPTTDPVAPIQKRIDILNDIFDKLTKVEKTLIFTAEPEYDPKLLANLTEILELNTTKSKTSKTKLHPKIFPTPASQNPDSPEYFLTKTREYLKTLYGSKTDESDEK